MAGALDREFISQLVPPLLGVLGPRGATLLIEKYGLPADSMSRRELAMPLRVFHALTEEAAQLANDPGLGLHLAQLAPRGSYGALEYTLRSAPSIREALERLRRYSALINGLIGFGLEVTGERATFTHGVAGAPMVNGRIGNEFSIALVVRVLRELSAQPFAPTEVWFGHDAPGDLGELRAFFGTEAIAFSRGHNGFAFAARFLAGPVVTADAALLPLVEEQARRLALSRQTAGDFPGEVREQTRQLLQSSSLGVGEVAKRLGQSQRTLQRRLSEHGTTFFAVLDGLREGLAREYVLDPKLGLGEIAYLLGYSELSAFSRSFKRWTGRTPGDYRRAPG